MTDLTITHTYADGTLIDGTSRGDGSAPVLKARGWRWSRNLGAWFVPRSRDTRADIDLIDTTRTQLQDAGFSVDVEVDDTPRAYAVVVADRVQRMTDRAKIRQEQADRAEARAEVAEEVARRAARALPPGGEPIHVGHHSEGRHRRAIDRAHTTMGRSVAADREATEAARRAAAAAAAVGAHDAPITVANRITKFTAELNAARRQLERYEAAPVDPARADALAHVRRQVADLEEKVTHWTAVRAEQIAAGTATNYGPDTVAAGDQVQIHGRWYEVVRANRKTVTVPSSLGAWTDTAPWPRVQDHRPATKEQQP